MLLKFIYGPNEVPPHHVLRHHINLFDASNNTILRVQEFDTETLVGKLPNGSAVNVDHFGWFPPSQCAYDELLERLPRGYHHLVTLIEPEDAQNACA